MLFVSAMLFTKHLCEPFYLCPPFCLQNICVRHFVYKTFVSAILFTKHLCPPCCFVSAILFTKHLCPPFCLRNICVRHVVLCPPFCLRNICVRHFVYETFVSAMLFTKHLRYDGASNEFLHDFVRATIDGLHLCIEVGFANGVLRHIPPTSVHLHTVVRYLVLKVRGPVFVHGSHGSIQLSIAVHLQAIIRERASQRDLCLHLGQSMLNCLKM